MRTIWRYSARHFDEPLNGGAAAALIRDTLARFPQHLGLRLASIDLALDDEHWAVALERIRAAQEQLGMVPALDLRAAQAYFALGQRLGDVVVREVPGGRVGRFDRGWLLVEERAPGQFLCCPENSAFFRVRRALDAGLDQPALHLLHARIWASLGKADVGFALLQRREAELLADDDAGDACRARRTDATGGRAGGVPSVLPPACGALAAGAGRYPRCGVRSRGRITTAGAGR